MYKLSLTGMNWNKDLRTQGRSFMGAVKHKNKTFLEIDTTKLSAAHIRQIKTLNALFSHMLATADESEFFKSSAEIMRMCGSLIQQANFPQNIQADSSIPYAKQALEYSLEILHDQISCSKVVSYDN